MTMDAKIINFDFSRRIVRNPASQPVGNRLRQRRIERLSSDKAGLSETRRNALLRTERDVVWRKADAVRHYWKARLEMEGAISRVKHLPEGDNHPPYNPDDRWTLLANWRQATVQQLLTPAPTAAAVNWKKATFAGGQHKYTDVKAERIERAIAYDLAFLAAHPIRGLDPKAAERRQRSREFKDAMRQRIRELAASRDLLTTRSSPS